MAGGPLDTKSRARERAETLAPWADTIADQPGATIEPHKGPDTGAERALEVLSRHAPTRTGAVELEHTLGEGGFGVVRLGRQVALGRTVAVKTARPETAGRQTTIRLLREGWVTGTLEHPNVVPIYDLGLEDENPIIVMKRIEGVVWGDVMHDADAIAERFEADDPLEWNLSILMQVINAIAFAHSRGVIHRDIKPENVMIGSFGEVYVLDWGIAVSSVDDGSGRLPLAKDAVHLAGTPSYMAPEMLGGKDVSPITNRTDVYLLGATLHEIVTGEPPHRGEHLMQMVYSMLSSPPDLPESVDPELARIVRRAMEAEPGRRYESAEQVQKALTGYLRHRGSLALTREADARLEKLRATLEAGLPSSEAAQHELYNVFGEARFGYQQALREWPDNGAARSGLDAALSAMIEHELSAEDPRAAARLLAELSAPDPELAARVGEGRDRERERAAELARLSSDLDPAIGKRTRTFVGFIFGMVFTVSPLLVGHVPFFRADNLSMAIGTALVFAVIAGVSVWARDSMSKTAVNRRVVLFGLAVVAEAGLAHHGGYRGGVPVETVVMFHPLVWALCAALSVFLLDRVFLLSVVAYLAAFGVAISSRDLQFYAIAAANSLLTVLVLATWVRQRDGTPLFPTAEERRSLRSGR